MRAILCRQLGPPERLELGELPSATLGPDDVRVRVHAAGVNFPDTLIIEGRYQFQPALPFAPGSEIAGVIDEIGADVRVWKPGDRVMAPTIWGAFAEEAVVPASSLSPIPDDMDDATAAAFSVVYGTAFHAFRQRAALAIDETVLVLGAAGGVGLAAVDTARALGARVIAAASTPAKLELCREYGAEHVIDYTREPLRERLKEITGGRGVDVVFDPVGGEVFEPSLRSLAWGGRHLVIGFAAGAIPAAKANLLRLKGASVGGGFWGRVRAEEPPAYHRNVDELQELWRRGSLRPFVARTYPLAEAPAALRALLSREAVGKLVVSVTA